MKKKPDAPTPLTIVGAVVAIFVALNSLICKSFRLFSDIRLHRLHNKNVTVTGYLDNNGGWPCYVFILIIGCWLARKFILHPKAFLWVTFTFIIISPILLSYLVYQDFPHHSIRADIFTEVMIIYIFAVAFYPIIDFIISSIIKKVYNHRFWMITGTYSIIYMFILPAIIGDIITMVGSSVK
ncbi:MAG TPA: hypothetical protein VM802_10255 [Chitinophaga sp.]|uniref:hypothetical protein n=1 Tax=Chitinophaga sp. TaxID=1869181 RepID=UPI002C85B4FE|nr:hypothetical protein [Chitinophaga sp.]HVI45245.1 hypothetical protein [Chitinophaga sp.]